ncbi:hypothetical protein CERSUDRAFT_141132 [Gelatoporia subvermispora B]|uniref:C2H2-type domain-containing protein n=1 Tax=Ceriporiopsis subvermispora (strain B) TaxID=914234 RepID=M2R4M6_CERS8|nr:hypothetical protein CERSUDRAFT_141132 [Gelatoporia subvermispora B]
MTYCDRCDRYFGSSRALKQHLENSGAHNICDDCNLDFSTWKGLKEHWVQSPRHDYCQRCDEHFSSQWELDEHYEDMHYYCELCNRIFDFELGLHEHRRQSHPGLYCISCKRMFANRNNLDQHLRSSVHQAKDHVCPGRGCKKAFVSRPALVLHWESGTCPSGITRDSLNQGVAKVDRGGIITNHARLLKGSESSGAVVSDTWATDLSWNGFAYECYICHRTFASLKAVNAHLRSPAHSEKIYRCPTQWYGCDQEFKMLSAFCQHVENGHCGVQKFKEGMNKVLDSLSSNMKRLTM